MAGENQLSPLFGDMQATPLSGASSSESQIPLPDKKGNILDALNFSDAEVLPESPGSGKTSTDSPVSLFSEVSPGPTSIVSESVPSIPAISPGPNSSPLVPQDLPVLEEITGERSLPLEKLSSVPIIPPEKIEKAEVPGITLETSKGETTPDPKLAQYLQADRVYQAMIRVENQEKIRLQLAIRYTLLMFAIFLVFAWIVSNRIIMFGFSEFVWLARIRDGLFALMAGLFSLTLWFGSVAWMRQTFLVAIFRTLSIVFFVAVIIALYIPLW